MSVGHVSGSGGVLEEGRFRWGSEHTNRLLNWGKRERERETGRVRSYWSDDYSEGGCSSAEADCQDAVDTLTQLWWEPGADINLYPCANKTPPLSPSLVIHPSPGLHTDNAEEGVWRDGGLSQRIKKGIWLDFTSNNFPSVVVTLGLFFLVFQVQRKVEDFLCVFSLHLMN